MSRFGPLAAVLVSLLCVVPLVYFAAGEGAGRDWRLRAVGGLTAAGVEPAFDDGSFLSEELLTGYQAAVLVGRVLDVMAQRTGCPDVAVGDEASAAGFADVPADHWAADAVGKIARLGVEEAFPEGSFGGGSFVSGYQAALLMARVLDVIDERVACGERIDAEVVSGLRDDMDAMRGAFDELLAEVEAGRLVGPVGPTGPAGETGPAGPTGSDGADGPEGPAGPPGPVGAAGETGVAGLTGDQGPEGPAGPMGPLGETGMVGDDGISCWDLDMTGEHDLRYDVNQDGVVDVLDCIGPAGPQGPAGAEGPAGPGGDAGPMGAVGPQGSTGSDGPVGPQGPPGPVGPQGSDGPVGPQGPQGPQGSQGPEGPEGPEGPVGPEGPEGPQGPAGGGRGLL
ncbi:hypothetical protein BH23DEI1_BH23DEI1_06070 [soil metagenome]